MFSGVTGEQKLVALGKHEKYTNLPYFFEGRPAARLNSFPSPTHIPTHASPSPTHKYPTDIYILCYDLLYLRTSLNLLFGFFLSQRTLLGEEGISDIG